MPTLVAIGTPLFNVIDSARPEYQQVKDAVAAAEPGKEQADLMRDERKRTLLLSTTTLRGIAGALNEAVKYDEETDVDLYRDRLNAIDLTPTSPPVHRPPGQLCGRDRHSVGPRPRGLRGHQGPCPGHPPLPVLTSGRGQPSLRRQPRRARNRVSNVGPGSKRFLGYPRTQHSPACGIAEQAHTGRIDKVGAPYIEHPAMVVDLLKRLPGYFGVNPDTRQNAVIAAWLHDVIEDTPRLR